MLSSIFRDDIFHWNTNLEENDEIVHNSEVKVSLPEEPGPELKISVRIEIFSIEESRSTIECF